MNLCRSLVTSAVLHGLLAFAIWRNAQNAMQPHATIMQVTFISRPTKLLNLKPRKALARLGSSNYNAEHSMTKALVAQNYLDRLHAHIDPNWQLQIFRAHMVAHCSTVLNIDADSNGTIMTIVILQNNCPDRLRKAALDTLWACNLIPPPKSLLDAGILRLEWTFQLSPRS